MNSDSSYSCKVLDSIDKEISFYRKRSGQVFFLGLFAEGFILVGMKAIDVSVSAGLSFLSPLIHNIFFTAVALVGITLGYKYRRRIHYLKEARQKIVSEIYTGSRVVSEIQMLYIVLGFLSSLGNAWAWIKHSSVIGTAVGLFFLTGVVCLLTYYTLKYVDRQTNKPVSQ